VGFFLTPFVIHHLGDRMYGLWVLVGTFIGYYGLLDLGLGNAITRYVARALGKGDREECGTVFSTALQLYICLGVVVVALSAVFAFLSSFLAHSQQDAALFWKVILILGFSVAFSFPANVYAGLLGAELRQDCMALTEILTQLLRTSLIIAVLMGGGKVLALAWVTFLCNVPRMASYVALTRRQFPWLRYRPQPWIGKWTKTLMSYGAFASISTVSDQLRVNADAFVVTAYVGLAAVTHFRIAGFMASCFVNLMIAVVGGIQPWFSRMEGMGNHQAIRGTLLFATKLSISVASFVGFALVAWGKPFIQRWMGSSYLDAYPCLVVLSLGYVIALGQSPSRLLLYGISKHKIFALINSVDGIANLGLSIWLARTLGIFGVALGTFIPTLVIKLTVQPLYVCHVSGTPFIQYLRELVRSLLLAGLALVVPVVISVRFVTATYTNLAVVGSVSLICYAVVTYFLQFTRQQREIIREAVRPRVKTVVRRKVLISEGDAALTVVNSSIPTSRNE